MVNHHLHWYLHLLEKKGLLEMIINKGNVKFGVRDPEL
jgi:hypothetical protein